MILRESSHGITHNRMLHEARGVEMPRSPQEGPLVGSVLASGQSRSEFPLPLAAALQSPDSPIFSATCLRLTLLARVVVFGQNATYLQLEATQFQCPAIPVDFLLILLALGFDTSQAWRDVCRANLPCSRGSFVGDFHMPSRPRD